MCLLALAYKTQNHRPLIVASNRDEFYPRPTQPMHWWSDAPILAGKDLDAGGTWLGLSRNGRFAAVTNYRYVDESGAIESKPLSRGQLVTDFLLSDAQAIDWATALGDKALAYGGFNLLLYDGDSLVYLNNFEDLAPQRLEPGVYALSNNRLDSPWPKVDHARAQLAELVETEQLGEDHLGTLIATLALQKTYAPELLPNTGVPQEWETLLSSPFIVAEGYGTRASAAVIISACGQIAVAEQSYEAGETLGSQTFKFNALDD
jgi:uncharacterized protein with NRDE domain